MNTITVWILMSLASGDSPGAVIHKFPDQESCVTAWKSIEETPRRYRCIPAKAFKKQEDM